jgi:hypothetical protein
MRVLAVTLSISILAFTSSGGASEKSHSASNSMEYRGYYADLSEIEGRKDFAAIVDSLKSQVNIVESVGVTPRVRKFFHTVPILVDEFACLDDQESKAAGRKPGHHAACYGPFAPQRSTRTPTYWDSDKQQWANADPIELAEDTKVGVILVRPLTLQVPSERPIILHELLHAYHANVLPQGVQNPTIILYYNLAKSEQSYPADAYLMSNEKEFFAVTASVFLYGKDDKITRANIKEKQPEYYNYLVWLFGFDPDRALNVAPLASAN